MEVMVVIAIGLALMLVGLPALGQIFQLQHRRAARDLALTYKQLHDEAVLRNITFRVAYNLEQRSYTIESGDADALVYATPEERVEAEKTREERTARGLLANNQAAAKSESFSKHGASYKTSVTLPDGAVFGGVYTPQYGRLMRPGDRDEKDKPLIVYSYIFPNGVAEHTIVQIVEEDDETEGFTIEVEPLSGDVKMISDVVDPRDSFSFVPDEGPDLPS